MFIPKLTKEMENFHRVEVQSPHAGRVLLYFSYETIVAVKAPEVGVKVARENIWGPTTGKHLNSLGKIGRYDSESFARLVEELFA